MEYYVTIKRNEVLIYATIWTSLENMLSERNQTQKATCLYEMFRIGKSMHTECKLVAA